MLIRGIYECRKRTKNRRISAENISPNGCLMSVFANGCKSFAILSYCCRLILLHRIDQGQALWRLQVGNICEPCQFSVGACLQLSLNLTLSDHFPRAYAQLLRFSNVKKPGVHGTIS